MKFWSLYLQYLQRHFEIVISHLAAAVPLMETDDISLVCLYIIKICPVLTACIWKNRVLLAAFWNKISIFHFAQRSIARLSVMVHFGDYASSIQLLLDSFDVILPSEREKPS